jgi:predicted MFS family arabinose efflux permease
LRDIPESPKLFSFEFLALCLILMAAFCNVSVFYGFYHYLGVIGIPLAWRGFLVGLEPMAAFALRLFVIPWIQARNAYTVLMVSLFLMIAASCSYLWVVTVPSMVLLRIVHGAAIVLLTSAVIALIVQFIPKEKSAQGFSIVSISTMIPYSVMPTLTEALLPQVRSEAVIYAGVSIFSGVSVFLLAALRNRLTAVLRNMDTALTRRPRMDEIRENFQQRSVVFLLCTAFLVYLAHATVFYFMKDLSLQTAIGDMGPFFTISMATMIAVRAFGSLIFDRMNKRRTLQFGLALLILCLAALPHSSAHMPFYLLAGLYGFCMGLILPLLNALLFLESPPPLRGLNTNLTMFTMDAGYFIMPYMGGMIIAFGAGFDVLYYIGAGFILLSLSFVTPLAHIRRR